MHEVGAVILCGDGNDHAPCREGLLQELSRRTHGLYIING